MGKIVSVVIPTYNRANIIKDAIETVIAQTYQDFEIIIVDDGSTDNTKEIVQSYQDDRIKYIYQTNSGKPSIARNKGIKEAKGDFIAFLDSDDLWHPQLLEKHINILSNNLDIGFTTNWNSYISFDGDKLNEKTCLAQNQKDYIKFILLNPDHAYPGPSGTVIRKICFEKIEPFDEKLDFCEDWDLFFRLAIHYNMYNIKEFLTYVRMHNESFTRNSQETLPRFKSSYLMFLEKSFNTENLPPEIVEIKNKVYSNVYSSFGGMLLYDRKKAKESREDYLKSLSYFHGRIFNIKFLVSLTLAFLPLPFLEVYLYLKEHYRKALRKNYL